MTRSRQDIERAEEEAADWLVRVQSGAMTEDQAVAFEAWLENPVNHAALERAEDLWLELDGATVETPSNVAQLAHAKPRAAPRRGAWPWAAGLAVAASVAGFILVFPGSRPPPAPTVYAAARGQNRVVALADGTRIHLGGGSRLLVSLGAKTRRVEMASTDGEAAFDVAKDAARPFVILAGDRSITVVGTEFDVRRAAGRLLVTVRRGIVDVAALAPGSRPVRLTPGKALSHKQGSDEVEVKTVDPAAAFGWTGGERTYRDERLEEIVADLNRYFETPIRVDAAIADLRFTGILKIDEEDAVVRRLQVFLPIQATRSEGVILLRRGPG